MKITYDKWDIPDFIIAGLIVAALVYEGLPWLHIAGIVLLIWLLESYQLIKGVHKGSAVVEKFYKSKE